MLRPLHRIVFAAGLAALVGCGSGAESGEETTDLVADSADQTVALSPPVEIPGAAHSFPSQGDINDGSNPPRRYSLIPCANPGQAKGRKQGVNAAGTGPSPISTPGRAHQLHVAAGVVPGKVEYEFSIQEVTNADGGCQAVITQNSGPAINKAGAFTLRIRCEHAAGATCPAERMMRLDDSTEVPNTRIETIGNNTYFVADLDRLSTYALASPEGFDQ